MAAILTNDWAPLLEDEFEKPYYKQLRQFLAQEYRSSPVYPDMYSIFAALHATGYASTKAMILGQDPYHGPGQAHGLSFSVQPGVPAPPSLQNMFKELQSDLGIPIAKHGYLLHWAQQGVLMLNTVLTVRESTPNSHKGKGWELFTDRVIATLNARQQPVIFVLWGSHAQQKRQMIDTSRHFIIQSPHPSPLSAHRGFFGSRPFSRINQYLQQIGSEPIDWRLPEL
ncbi:uracil-DNA glycosylase [Paenibacillus koleovorans]|uniref:uracil-DNA glycosylase n=1 Tax=Paenibacillus koleovorans TaxID=121608 RepID=UPI000FD6C70C|nr:uracil-DNA glycosylase [Paenibacillus koleovorans]